METHTLYFNVIQSLIQRFTDGNSALKKKRNYIFESCFSLNGLGFQLESRGFALSTTEKGVKLGGIESLTSQLACWFCFFTNTT